MKDQPTLEQMRKARYLIWRRVRDWPDENIIDLCSSILGRVSEKKAQREQMKKLENQRSYLDT